MISVMVTDQPQLEEKENNSDFVVVKIPESPDSSESVFMHKTLHFRQSGDWIIFILPHPEQ